MNLSEARRRADRVTIEHAAARSRVSEERTQVASFRAELERTEEGRKIIAEVAQAVQQHVHAQVSRIVSRCLEAVFPDPYTFEIFFEEKRGKTEARLAFVRDGIEYDPVTAAGGGVCDVAAFGLRLAALVLSRPRRRRLLVLDEPFRMISRNYAPAVRELLEDLSAELDLQIVMVTHDPALAAGTVVEIG